MSCLICLGWGQLAWLSKREPSSGTKKINLKVKWAGEKRQISLDTKSWLWGNFTIQNKATLYVLHVGDYKKGTETELESPQLTADFYRQGRCDWKESQGAQTSLCWQTEMLKHVNSGWMGNMGFVTWPPIFVEFLLQFKFWGFLLWYFFFSLFFGLC